MFELIVIFFELTNLPAIFQAIINKLLRNLINIKNIRSFIDNIIISKKEHNKLGKNILKKINDFYIKLEKYK